MEGGQTRFFQHSVILPPKKRGCHLVTSELVSTIKKELATFKIGLAHLFRQSKPNLTQLTHICLTVQHTSASLTVNENYDTDVRKGNYAISQN
jgi:thiamine phosphate synthase YjbQ (UPF0047 family)